MRHFGNIAQLIKTSRLNHPKKYSQTELSAQLGYKNGQFISNIERGLCSVPVKSLSQLTKTLDIDPETLKSALLKDMEKTLDNYLKMDPATAASAPDSAFM
ncbi:MAG: XRE family transcriptional regulator [Deltaproteobacteria bacterium]|nr:MAG: XRE family transcriptional regulator [Deltaproteobacteria bacterium]TNF30303.1 MAG: XRE family transcriptional regulator [Deltaproteobacteria bacterium]